MRGCRIDISRTLDKAARKWEAGPSAARLAAASALVALMLVTPLAATVSGTDVLYTLDADFLQGTLINTDLSVPDQLQLGQTTAPLPFIWVAASARGTIVRIDTVTGAILGEYRTAPQGRGLNPSRTTVDLFGNVWTGNRNESGSIGGVAHGSAVKVGLVVGGSRVNGDGTPNPAGDYLAPPFSYNTCVDRDTDGLIKTSRGLGDIRPWPDVTDGVGGADGLVQDADDECVLIYQRLFDADAARHVSIDANNDVWIGGYPFAQRSFHKLDGTTGAVLASFNARNFGCGGYGGLVDGNGILWSASLSQNRLMRYDPATASGGCVFVSQSYGLGIDTNGFLWNSMWVNNSIVKVDGTGAIQPGFPKTTGGSGNDRGVAVTPADNHVWVANSGGANVSRLDNNGNVLKVIGVGSTPTGVSVDAAGKVWVTNRDSNNVMRIDPGGGGDGLGAVDLTVGLGAGAGPYNYSDMTGQVAIGSTSPQGTWSVVQDSGVAGTAWGTATWNLEPEGFDPPGTGITVEVRAADTQAGLASQSFVTVSSAVPFSISGAFIEVRATLKPIFSGVSPILSDIRVQVLNNPPVALCTDVTVSAGPNCTADASIDDGSFDPDGDPLSSSQVPPGPYGLGDTQVTLTVEDDSGASDSCTATVTVVDDTPPVIQCNSPMTIVPPDAPISFTATAADNCGSTPAVITGFDCFMFTKKGKRIDKTSSCVVSFADDQITILDSGGVDDHITWTAEATDASGNTSSATCEVLVVNPGSGPM